MTSNSKSRFKDSYNPDSQFNLMDFKKIEPIVK